MKNKVLHALISVAILAGTFVAGLVTGACVATKDFYSNED